MAEMSEREKYQRKQALLKRALARANEMDERDERDGRCLRRLAQCRVAGNIHMVALKFGFNARR